ncbi:hypothetical protein CONLIGDRAFT_714146 [Coniochaeta ligniaria NRRL 30616]|uniref:Uncharacterized protein n=1 Tax=Coniochaeta ligniaria NRRL 30616 TaxID=1408157 RepID=A0A1J7JIP6_9PEZI|nr:hypothetical protein CONLIGDRAFT_714146 [Coniochaeta ligniaria NRRL 30616]
MKYHRGSLVAQVRDRPPIHAHHNPTTKPSPIANIPPTTAVIPLRLPFMPAPASVTCVRVGLAGVVPAGLPGPDVAGGVGADPSPPCLDTLDPAGLLGLPWPPSLDVHEISGFSPCLPADPWGMWLAGMDLVGFLGSWAGCSGLPFSPCSSLGFSSFLGASSLCASSLGASSLGASSLGASSLGASSLGASSLGASSLCSSSLCASSFLGFSSLCSSSFSGSSSLGSSCCFGSSS